MHLTKKSLTPLFHPSFHVVICKQILAKKTGTIFLDSLIFSETLYDFSLYHFFTKETKKERVAPAIIAVPATIKPTPIEA